MNKSIRYKLLGYMTGSILVFALLLLAANTFFAEKYYVQHNKSILIKTSKEITQLIKNLEEPSDFQQEDVIYRLNRLEKSIGGSVIIGKMAGQQYYPIYREIKGLPPKALIVNPFVEIGKGNVYNKKIYAFPKANVAIDKLNSIEVYDENSFFVITKDPGLKIDTLRYQTHLENDLMILVWIPMAEISESAAVSNRFTAIVALITMLITGFWTLYISDKFTRPIKQINTTSKKMAELDFSQTLNINSEDEIGQLSQSINYLSHKLKITIGELSKKNQQLEKDIDKGKKIDIMRREFVSNVSHELKTPIFLIQGYAEGLKNNVVTDQVKRSFYCDVIMEEAEKMDAIVKDLLNLSQIESGNMDLNKCDFNMEQLIVDVLNKLEPVFKEKDISIDTDIDVSHMVNGDAVRIEQILVNYLNNAVNHVDSLKKIIVTTEERNNKMRVSVFNSGQHIPEELLERIWISFYKVDKARTRSYGGTGLGLAIVKAIQQAHGNEYGVFNTQEGVAFWFDIDLGDSLT
jgi:two-component system, OmpR family, sensor histidine kinase VanS